MVKFGANQNNEQKWLKVINKYKRTLFAPKNYANVETLLPILGVFFATDSFDKQQNDLWTIHCH